LRQTHHGKGAIVHLYASARTADFGHVG